MNWENDSEFFSVYLWDVSSPFPSVLHHLLVGVLLHRSSRWHCFSADDDICSLFAYQWWRPLISRPLVCQTNNIRMLWNVELLSGTQGSALLTMLTALRYIVVCSTDHGSYSKSVLVCFPGLWKVLPVQRVKLSWSLEGALLFSGSSSPV